MDCVQYIQVYANKYKPWKIAKHGTPQAQGWWQRIGRICEVSQYQQEKTNDGVKRGRCLRC